MLKIVKKMRLILILGLGITMLLVAASSAKADTVNLTGPMVSVGPYGVGPVNATLNTIPVSGGMACLDISKDSYYGVPFDATISTLQPVNMTNARFGSDTTAIHNYEEAAWLLGQMPSNPNTQAQITQVANLQYAVWKIFDVKADGLLTTYFPGWDQTAVQGLLEQVGAINLGNYDFSSVHIYTPTAAYASNQEFMSGGAINFASQGNQVPIPASFVLLGSGLLGLGLIRYGKSTVSVRQKRESGQA